MIFTQDVSYGFCTLYVSVSGADPGEDLACALAAIDPIKDFFASEKDIFTLHYPGSAPEYLLEKK